ncbi:type IV toxin-antitoxin system AbiEi family antitoxin domain-containing protein [Kribbella sp. CA-245084]|uniref:type IV toxin-antitoxin system AbiEi family antitoxin domain-containing protein n=1 Tax=Kribbella sp. CA-245084 TaxID=3239940 RepID=UPI003D8DAC8B
MPSVAEILDRLGGCATAAQLSGVTSAALKAAVARGEIERLARGVYGLASLGQARLAAIGYDGVVSHTSAAVAWGLPVLVRPEKPHVTVPANRRPRAGRPAELHWAGVSRAERADRLTSLLRTVLDCARILPFGEALAIADAALATGRLTKDELESAAAAMRGPGRPNAVRVAAEATRQSESFLESMLRSLLITAGIGGFESQVVVQSGGTRARVDLGHRAARVALEAEGYEFHGSPAAFAADCRRYDDLVTAGWLVLRFTYQQVIGDPAWVVESVRSGVANDRR